MTTERSHEKITKKDLEKLLRLAREDISSFFKRNSQYKAFKGKEVIVVLAQGAALHYIDGKNGIKDFDVWFFYPKKGIETLYYRKHRKVDFGKSKFGRHPDDNKFEGRCVDVLKRSDAFFNKGYPVDCLKNYLQNKKTKTSNFLAQKAMIGLWPEKLFGEKLWIPPSMKK